METQAGGRTLSATIHEALAVPLHSGQRLSESRSDKVIQALNEEPNPFIPIYQIAAIHLMAGIEDDLLALSESQLGQNGRAEQDG